MSSDDKKIYTLGESVQEATKLFRVFEEGKPDLVQLGLPAVDKVLGGLFPGSCGILAAATGVGKSSIMLASALKSGSKVGIISTEDTADVVGTRILAAASGIDSLRIRRGDLTLGEVEKLRKAQKGLSKASGVRIAYEVGSGLEEVLTATQALIQDGCKLIWLDYVQKVRGVSEDRRNEVSTVYTKFQRECDRGGAAGMVISQFRRLQEPTKSPQIYHLKESGDLENEARLIILCHRDSDEQNLLHFRIAKSTFGGENVHFMYRRDKSGTLREYVSQDEEW